jgi:hypothetical protein
MQALPGNRYRLGERIADGGMGSVYRAVDDTGGAGWRGWPWGRSS